MFSKCKHVLYHQPKCHFINSNLHSAFLKLTNVSIQNYNNNGLFNKLELIDHHGYEIMEKESLKQCQLIVEKVCSGAKSNQKIVALFDNLSDTLCQTADLAEFIRHCHPNNLHSQTASKTYYAISDYVEGLNTNVDLYAALKQSVTHGDPHKPLDEIDIRTANLFLLDFEQSGIHLDKSRRSQFVKAFGQHIRYGTKFMETLMNPVTVNKKEALPEIIKYLHESDSSPDKYIVPQVYSHVNDKQAREALYKLYYRHDPWQQSNLIDLLRARFDMAKVVDFPSYADKCAQNSFASNLEAITQFLDRVNTGMRPLVSADLDILKKHGQPVLPWNVEHIMGKMRADLYHLGRELSNYFSLPDCIQGLNDILEALFGVVLKVEDVQSQEQLWSPDVFKLSVHHSTTGLLGYIYCDFFARPQKPPMDCHFTIRGGRERFDRGGYQNPVIVVSLNLPPVHDLRRCQLTPQALENFFHEMGHAAHSMLGRTRYQHVTGTRCSTDFAEIPSNLMELYASDCDTLLRLGRHKENRSGPPPKLVKAYLQNKQTFAAVDHQTQLYYSALDLTLHGCSEVDERNIEELVEETHKAYHMYPVVKGISPHLKFGHIVGYGAKYYSYLVAKSVAQSIWQEYFDDDPLSPKAGQKFLNLIKYGGERRPQEILQEVFDSENPVQITQFADSIATDLKEKYKKLHT